MSVFLLSVLTALLQFSPSTPLKYMVKMNSDCTRVIGTCDEVEMPVKTAGTCNPAEKISVHNFTASGDIAVGIRLSGHTKDSEWCISHTADKKVSYIVLEEEKDYNIPSFFLEGVDCDRLNGDISTQATRDDWKLVLNLARSQSGGNIEVGEFVCFEAEDPEKNLIVLLYTPPGMEEVTAIFTMVEKAEGEDVTTLLNATESTSAAVHWAGMSFTGIAAVFAVFFA